MIKKNGDKYNNLFFFLSGTNKPDVIQREVRYLVSGMSALRTLCLIVSFPAVPLYLISPLQTVRQQILQFFLHFSFSFPGLLLLLTTKKSWQKRSERANSEGSRTGTLRS